MPVRSKLEGWRRGIRLRHPSLPLFWRTFVLLALLLASAIFAWVQTIRALESGTRAVQAAQQIASLVNLSREALRYADGINRVTVLKAMSDSESVSVLPREPADTYEPFGDDPFSRRVASELRMRLGAETLVAHRVNGVQGVWVGFPIDKDPYWLQADPRRIHAEAPLQTWVVWIGVALVTTVIGCIAIARLINQPLRDLSYAATRLREGEFDSALDETTLTSEIREVNMGFNRMARELAKVEEDRAVMLAGISHDLRTPLARLRLEAEISVADEEVRNNMAQDIDQLDAIIGKFMEYARPHEVRLKPVRLADLVEREMSALRYPSQIQVASTIAGDVKVLADEIELGRVFANLFENARRYGRSPDSGIAHVDVSCERDGAFIVVSVRDHGSGVDPAKLHQLTTPFFRGDAARTHATGAGLGLAIVEKTMQRMGGRFEVGNAHDGGFVAHVTLKRAP